MKAEELKCWAEIDLDAMENNFDSARKKLPPEMKLMAVIKADAYGHGAVEAAKLLEKKADYFAVATADEALELRNADIKNPILILGHVLPCDFEKLIKRNITLCISDTDEAEILSGVCKKLEKSVKIHIALDTGMGRIGFPCNENSIREILEINKLYGIETEGVFSHFAKADSYDKSYAESQLENFKYMTSSLEKAGLKLIRHIFNSAAIVDIEPQYDMGREGIILYGMYPSPEVNLKNIGKIKAVMTLKSRIMHLKISPKGTAVSYGCTYVTDKETKIATIGAGYADGVPRLLSNKGKVFVNGVTVPIIGRVCMDQFMIDVTDVPNVKKYDEVVLFGEKEKGYPTADEVAESVGTIGYELTCGINRRVPRVYIKNGKVVKIKGPIYGLE